MAQGDDMFSEESITAVETALTEYVQTLCEAIQKKNATTVYNSMGKLVKKINKINDKYGLRLWSARNFAIGLIHSYAKRDWN